MRPRPHDLLRVRGAGCLASIEAPDWVGESLVSTPWVVVRRAAAAAGLVAVGIRGVSRAHRYALTISQDWIETIIGPEDLAEVDSVHAARVFQILTEIRPMLNATGFKWGPTGSVGFELATGTTTANSHSDLDLIVRIGSLNRDTVAQLAILRRELPNSDCRIDCQVELPAGAVALTELVGDQVQVLLRTPTGALLTTRDELASMDADAMATRR